MYFPFGIVSPADPYASNVTLLLHGDGPDGQGFFWDRSPQQQPITTVGCVKDTAEKKFGTASIWFDNTNDYLTITDVAADFNWEFEDHTIEFWVKNFGDSWAGWQSASGRPICIGKQSVSGSSAQWLFGILDDGSLTFTYNNGGAVQLETVTKVPTTGWNHVAMCNDGQDIKLFINGTLELTQAISGVPVHTADNILIGHGYGRNIHGWLDEIRITKGIARYTGNFDVPTAEFPDLPPATPIQIPADYDPYWTDVVLLLHCDGADTSTTFTDSSLSAHTATPSGNVQMDVAQSKSGGASALFDNAGDYLSIPYVAGDFDWWGHDHTIEFWAYAASWASWDDGRSPAHPCVIGRCSATSTTDYWNFGPIDDATLVFRYYNGSTQAVISADTLPTNEWVHCAMVVDSGMIRLYINGAQTAQAAVVGTPQSVSQNLTIGQNNSQCIDGWIDDLRVTNGTARYREDFTPLPTAFPETT